MKYVVVLSLVMLTVVKLSAQSVSLETTDTTYDSLSFHDAKLMPLHSEMPFSRLRPSISHHNTMASSSLFKPTGIGDIEICRATYNNPSTCIPMNYGGGNVAILTKERRYVLGMTGSHRNYHSMGFSNSFTIEQSWAITDGITISGGVYASDNLYHTNRFKDLGVSGRVNIVLTDGVTLKGYGSYSVYNSASDRAVPPMMYSENHYGGSVEVKITDKFGLEGGVQRGFNMFTRKWESSYYVLPVFY